MCFAIIDTDHLHTVVGGEQPAAQAAAPSNEDRIRALRQEMREEMRLRDKEREKDEFTAWEKRHPFQALICQGDRDCMR